MAGLYFMVRDVTPTLCELQTYYRGKDPHKSRVQAMMVRGVSSLHTITFVLVSTHKSFCPASITNLTHKSSVRTCLALLNVKCFVPVFLGRKFLPDILISHPCQHHCRGYFIFHA